MKVTARGNEIGIDCNGKRLIQAHDGTFDSGSIGLRVVDTHAAFSDIQIIPEPDKNVIAPPLAEGR
jgi:hypothetical protein